MTSQTHLSEERTGLPADQQSDWERKHLQQCGLCRERVALARTLADLDGIGPRAERDERVGRLVPLMRAAVEAEHAPAEMRVLMGRPDQWVVDGRGMEMRYGGQRAATTRRSRADAALQPVHFRRQFGDLELHLEVQQAPSLTAHDGGTGYHLAVRLEPIPAHRASAHLSLEVGDGSTRELAVQPLSDGATTFLDMMPGAILLEVFVSRVCVGRVRIDVGLEREAPE